MFNQSLKQQLTKAIKDGKIKVKYPDGYKNWKRKFDYLYKTTKSVDVTLDAMYGPNGGVDNYKGSIYTNSNVQMNKKPEKPTKKKESNFKFLEVVKKK